MTELATRLGITKARISQMIHGRKDRDQKPVLKKGKHYSYEMEEQENKAKDGKVKVVRRMVVRLTPEGERVIAGLVKSKPQQEGL